jgi:nucleoid-associated protein YgaU
VLAVTAAFLVDVTPRYWGGDLAATPEAPVLALALLAAYGCLGWLALLLVAVAARTRVALPGRAFAERLLGVAAVTAAAGALAAGPAVADPSPAPFDRPGPPVAAGPFDRLAPPEAAPAPAPRTAPAEVVVRRGDTLWGIAARHLGGRATPAAVAAEWPRWYAANRAVVGPDPHLILPGQRLVAPPNGAAR